eukprot:8431727-Lingulodinium_polyedra.AAC.1
MLRAVVGSVFEALVGAFGRWVRRRVEHGFGRPVRQWQWKLVVVRWCMEQAGIAEFYNTDFAEARELVRQFGVNAQAGRQAVFEVWQQGNRACEFETQFLGQKAARRTAEAMDKFPWK